MQKLVTCKKILDQSLIKKNKSFANKIINNKLSCIIDDNDFNINIKINYKEFFDQKKGTSNNLFLNLIEIKRSKIFSIDKNNLINVENDGYKHYIIDDFIIDKNNTINNNIFSDYISASKVRNFLLNDTLVDYLKMYGYKEIEHLIENNYQTDSKDIFNDYILNEGNNFENKVLNYLMKEHQVITVCENYQDIFKRENFNKTLELIKNKKPIIYQGLLVDDEMKLYGCPDLIVRTDIIKKIFPEIKLDCMDNDYLIVDIKMSTLDMNSDDRTIRNSGSIPAFKGQLYIYNLILEKIQKSNNNLAIIWSKSKKNNTKNYGYHVNYLDETFGIIDYNNKDKNYINLTNDAINWINLLKKEGSDWKLLPKPSNENLYPNLKQDSSGKYQTLKRKYAKEIGDLTQIWNCSHKRRRIAFDNNIYDVNNKKLNSSKLGFKENSKTGYIVDKIIKTNQGNQLINPKKIKNNLFDWRNKKRLEIFIDFETMNSLFDNISNRIFMIGICYNIKGKYYEKNYLMKENNNKGEIDMFNEFYKDIEKLEKELNTNAIFYHWHDAEPIFYNKFQYKSKDLDFRDLKKIFMEEPITIKNCYSFKLKDVATSMYNHKMIKTCWDNKSNCSDGRKAMVIAYNIYKNNESLDCNLMNEIIRYNMVDVRVLYEIMNYMRLKL